MKTKIKTLPLLLVIGVALFSSCKKEKEEENDEEVITTLIVKFTPVGGGAPLQFSFDDADGPGGNPAIKQTIALAANRTYNVSLELSNKTTNPVTNITDEIIAEADAHRFYYQPAAGSNITVSNLNNDGNGVPLGVTSTWTTTSAANGTIKITLRHYANTPPNKATADPVDSPKSATDIEVDFVTSII